MGPDIAPRWPQDRPKTILKSLFFRLRFCLRFWFVCDALLVPCWVSSWRPLGARAGLVGLKTIKVDPWDPKMPQEAAKTPQEVAKTAQDALQDPRNRPRRSPRQPKRPPRPPKRSPRPPKMPPKTTQDPQNTFQDHPERSKIVPRWLPRVFLLLFLLFFSLSLSLLFSFSSRFLP